MASGHSFSFLLKNPTRYVSNKLTASPCEGWFDFSRVLPNHRARRRQKDEKSIQRKEAAEKGGKKLRSEEEAETGAESTVTWAGKVAAVRSSETSGCGPAPPAAWALSLLLYTSI